MLASARDSAMAIGHTRSQSLLALFEFFEQAEVAGNLGSHGDPSRQARQLVVIRCRRQCHVFGGAIEMEIGAGKHAKRAIALPQLATTSVALHRN